MKFRRLALYFGLLVLLTVLGFALTLWALFACAPPPLPGDELWTWRQNASAALALVLRFGSAACFTQDAAGSVALALGTRTAGVLLVLLALFVLWETIGRELRLRWFRMRGGHMLLAGALDDVAGLARRRAGFAGTVFLAPDRPAATDLARHHPFAEIAATDSRRLPAQLMRFGAARAKLLAAVTRNDLANVAIADSALATPGSSEILVRLEQHAVRVLSSHRLRVRAADQTRPLAVVSLTQMQTRRGMAAAMSGRYLLDGAPRVHIALCGSGPTLQAVSFEIARQGFGLETERPLLSILRTGSSDFAAGALHRLEASAIAEAQIADVLSASADGLDRAIGATVQEAPPLLAVHCTGESAAEAEAIALRWEEVLLALRQPVPPIVVYGAEDRPLGTTGMIRVATADDLAEARAAAHLMDQHARAVHQQFMAAQRAARGDRFGTAPAEVDWSRLPESFQDDNRNVADQMGYKLASVFMLATTGGEAARLTTDETEVLSGIAHARWMAAKALSGWRFGKIRDDRLMLHPDMVPYAELDEPGKQKDRDEVASLPAMASLSGESLKRERRIGLPRALDADAAAIFRNFVATAPKASVPVVVLPLDDAAMVEAAAALLDAGILVEAMLDRWTDDLRRDDAIAPVLATVLRRAWRITVLRNDEARRVLSESVTECADETGVVDALA
ncbi:MAG: RyR domain-containing protein [Devosia sp.]